MSILLFGGTFDPVHLGHLNIAKAVQQHFHFSSCLFLPCHVPVHKPGPSTTAAQRIHMLSLALKECPIEHASICLDEIHRAPPSFTVDTLKNLRQRMDEMTSITLLIGMDSLLSFLDWHAPHTILQLSHLLVVQRHLPDITFSTPLQTLLEHHQVASPHQLLTQPSGSIAFFNAGLYDISSRTIREQIQHHQPYQHRIPKTVSDYIDQKNLYK